jgi:hypothetical protein
MYDAHAGKMGGTIEARNEEDGVTFIIVALAGEGKRSIQYD